ncbi:MAG: NAD(P)/FAD-dependent oxidoreductase [Gammaproteobacteria bacterium]|nr:NAD(P)/FAD-dependent oxidoreductase [Gammaproteobacteria bacterium]
MGANSSNASRTRVVIVGAGFGGIAAARALAKTHAEVTVIDRRNYHLFQPLLYQVATAALSPADIAWPIRGILGKQENVRVELGRVVGVDRELRQVQLAGGRLVPYDYLILATGARHAYFGHDTWEGVAPGLKKIDDATLIRQRVLLAFERAEIETDRRMQRALLTFVVIGAGPTGVEMAGAIAELARTALACDFRRIDPASARVVLIEAGPRVLPSFSESLSQRALKSLKALGVRVLLGLPVTQCDDAGVIVDGMRISARTIVWAAGVAASPAARWLGVDADRQGRVVVSRNLSVPGDANTFVVGDTALAVDAEGKPLPGVAPVAKQMGAYVGRLIARRLSGKQTGEEPEFRYRDYGNLATIGRKAAVAQFGRLKLWGFPAWLLWAAAHVYFLIGARNRIVVSLNWLWNYVTLERGARLIIGASEEAPELEAIEGRVASPVVEKARAA